MKEITYPQLIPRPYQMPIFRAMDRGVKRLVYTHPRRHGKDVVMLMVFIREAMKRAGNYWYLFPTRSWAERAIWDNIQEIEVCGDKKSGKLINICLGDLPVEQNQKNLSIKFPNGSLLRFGGTDDLSFVGQGGYGYGLSEYSIHKPEVTSYISPILEEANAWMIMQGTLRGRQNHLYKSLEMGWKNPDIFTQWLTPEITKAYCWVGNGLEVNPELLGQINPATGRKYLNIQTLVDAGEISYSLAYREYLNRATNSTEEGYYSNEYEVAKGENRLGVGGYDPKLPVYTFWDIGKGTAQNNTDAMAMWMVQFPDDDLPNPKRIQMIGFEETRGGLWEDHARLLRQKGYEYGGHYAPWDINKGQAGIDGNNLLWAREAGIQFTPVPKRGFGIMDAIELCRRCWALVSFSRGSAMDGAERLSEYHEKRDREGNYLGKPEHNSRSSNVADGFRTLVEALDKKLVVYDPPKDATQAHTAVEVLTMRHAGQEKQERDAKPMLCGRGVGVTKRTKADIIRQRKEKIARRRQFGS